MVGDVRVECMRHLVRGLFIGELGLEQVKASGYRGPHWYGLMLFDVGRLVCV